MQYVRYFMFGIQQECAAKMTGVVQSLGATPTTRLVLFAAVCIPLRLALAWAASRAHGKQAFRPIAVVLSLVAIYTTATGGSGVWWYRRAHAAHALAIFLLVMLGKPEYVSHVLLSDVVFGVLTSLMKTPFTQNVK